MKRRSLANCLSCLMMFGLVMVVAPTQQAQADFAIVDNFGPVQVGFSALRRDGWWNDSHVNGTQGAIGHDAPPAVITPTAEILTGSTTLPESFPVELVAPIEGTGALYQALYARPAFGGADGNKIDGTGDFNGNGSVYGRDFLGWQRGESPSALSASDLNDWQAFYGDADSWRNPDVTSANRLELSLAATDAAETPGYSDVSAYDNADPEVRGTATLSVDYRLTYVAPAPDQFVPLGTIFPPSQFTHPSNEYPYDVKDRSDAPVEMRAGLLYLDQDTIPANENCDSFTDNNNCWNYVGGSGLNNDFSTVDDSEDTFVQIIDDEDLEWFELIADGEVHTLEIPMTFLTADERIAEQWMDNVQGLPEDIANEFWNNPNFADNLRIDFRGGTPHLLVIDNITLTAQTVGAVSVPEPTSCILLLASLSLTAAVRRR